MECKNLCRGNNDTCNYCKRNYIVSNDEYKAKREVNNVYVYGYLVKDKKGKIQGILNKDTHYAELAWIDENTIERICSEIK